MAIATQGHDLATGATVKGHGLDLIGNTAVDTFRNVPQARLAGQPLRQKPTPPTKLYRADWRSRSKQLVG